MLEKTCFQKEKLGKIHIIKKLGEEAQGEDPTVESQPCRAVWWGSRSFLQGVSNASPRGAALRQEGCVCENASFCQARNVCGGEAC